MSVKQGTTNSVPKTEPLKNKKYEYRAVEYTPLKYAMSPATSIGGGSLVGRFTDMLYQDTANGILLNYVYYRETSGATWQYTLEFTHNSITNVFTMVDASGQTVNEWDSSVSSVLDLLIPEYDPSKRTPITDYQNYFDTLIDEPIEQLEPVTLQERFDEIPTAPSNFSYESGVMSYDTDEGTKNVVMQRVGRLSIPSASSTNIWLWVDGIAKANTTYLVDISTAQYGYNDSCKFLITCTYPGGNNQGLSFIVTPICGTLAASDFFPGRREATTNYNDMAIRRPFTDMNSVVNVYQINGPENASSTIRLQVQNYKNMTGNSYELGANYWKTLADPSKKYIISDWTKGGVTNFPTYLHFNFSTLPSGVYEIYVEIMTATNSQGSYSSKLSSAGYQMTINKGTTTLYDIRYLYKDGSDIDASRFSPTDITMVRSTTSSYYYQMRVYIAQIGGQPYNINGMAATFDTTPTSPISIAAVWPDVNAQPKTLSSAITIGGVSITTVEAALQALANSSASVSPSSPYNTLPQHMKFYRNPFGGITVSSWTTEHIMYSNDSDVVKGIFVDQTDYYGKLTVVSNGTTWECYVWNPTGTPPVANIAENTWYKVDNGTYTYDVPDISIVTAGIQDSTNLNNIGELFTEQTQELGEAIEDPKYNILYGEDAESDIAALRTKTCVVDGEGIYLITLGLENAPIPTGIVSGNIGYGNYTFTIPYLSVSPYYYNSTLSTTGHLLAGAYYVTVNNTLISLRFTKNNGVTTLNVDSENNISGLHIYSVIKIA